MQTTYSDEDAERIGFAAEELAAAADLTWEDAHREVVLMVEAYRGSGTVAR